MYGYIQKACYFRLVINKKSFDKLLKECDDTKKNNVKENIKIKLRDTPAAGKAVATEVEFIRFIHDKLYIDITIKKIQVAEGFIIQLEKILDHNAHGHSAYRKK